MNRDFMNKAGAFFKGASKPAGFEAGSGIEDCLPRDNNVMGVTTHMKSASLQAPESALAASGRSGSASLLTGKQRRRGGRAVALSSMCVMFAMVVVVVVVPKAEAAFGDDFGIAPINDGTGPEVPAFPVDRALWAGTCDLEAGPASGIPILGGVGGCPDQILSIGGRS